MEILERLRCFYDNADCDECMLDVRDAIEELERLYAERRWIPVEEELPEHGEEVLGWQTSNVGDHWWPGVFVCHRWDRDTEHVNAGEWFSEEGKLWNVTHWQPLPSPPDEAT